MNTVPLAQGSVFPNAGEVLLEKYAVERILGEGGMGAVLRAHHRLRQVPVALKFIHPNVLAVPGAVERFYNEAVAASRISNEHVVQILDVDRLPSGAPFIVMEFLQGHDLAAALERAPAHQLSVARAIHITLQTLRAIAVAHRAGVVHRDMKPSNVFLVERDGDPDFVKLVDFGISKVRSENAARDSALTQINSTLGTPLYMAPEQARSASEVDSRCDLYSVGVILYEMLAGRTPFVADTGQLTEILYKLFTTEPPSLAEFRPDLEPGIVAAVARAMQKDPALRYGTAAAFAADLAPFADERSANELHRMRQAELAAGGALSDALEPARYSVRVRHSTESAAESGYSATVAGTGLHHGGPVVLGRGLTEAMPISSDPEPRPAPATERAPVPRAVLAFAFAAALVLAAALMLRRNTSDVSVPMPAATSAAVANPSSTTKPTATVAEPVPPGTIAQAVPPTGATPTTAAPEVPTGGTSEPRPKSAGPSRSAGSSAAPGAKPKLNDLGLAN